MRVRAAIRSFLLATLVGVVGLAWVTSVLAAPGDRATPMRQAIVQCFQELGFPLTGGIWSGATVAGPITIANTGASNNIVISSAGSITIQAPNASSNFQLAAGSAMAMGDTDSSLTTSTLNALVTVTKSTGDATVTADSEAVATFSGAGLTMTAGNTVSAPTLTSTVATGTAPFAVTSTTVSTNLNADLLDAHSSSYFVAEGAWTSWTVSGGTWVSNATYTGVYRHRGQTLECNLHVALAGAPTSTFLSVDLPAGFTIDGAAFAGGSVTQDYSLGTGICVDISASSVRYSVVRCDDNNTVGIYCVTTQPNIITNITQAVPFTFAISDYVDVRFSCPVTTAAAP